MEGAQNYEAHHSHDYIDYQETLHVCGGQFSTEHRSNALLHESQVHEKTIEHQPTPILQGTLS